MNNKKGILVGEGVREIIIFTVGDLLCGLDIAHAQEINRNLSITPVPQSSDYVRGVLNLRGQVITVIDLRVKLELEPVEITPDMRIIVVRKGADGVGLLVDGVDDIVPVREEELTPPPANIGGVRGEFFDAVYNETEIWLPLLTLKKYWKKKICGLV